MHIVAHLCPIDLHNFKAKYQRVVSFWVPVNYPSLNELVCVSYLSEMILLSLDLQGALFHSPLELKITVNSIQSQKHLGICLPTAEKSWKELATQVELTRSYSLPEADLYLALSISVWKH
jgi:hypothetical protein